MSRITLQQQVCETTNKYICCKQNTRRKKILYNDYTDIQHLFNNKAYSNSKGKREDIENTQTNNPRGIWKQLNNVGLKPKCTYLYKYKYKYLIFY